MNLKQKVSNLAFFSVLDIILGKLIHVISLLVVLRFLPREDFGVIGLSYGYLAFLSLLSLAPETILYRDFLKIKLAQKVNLHISAFLIFGFVRTLVILIIGCIIGGYLYWYYKSWIIPISFIVITLGSNIIIMQGPIKELLRVDFKQKVAAITGFFIEIIILGVLILVLYLSPSLVTYLTVFLSASFGAFGIWLIILKKVYNYSWIFNRESISVLKYSIKDFSLWNHFNGTVSNLLYNVDTAILSLIGISLSIIGNYTVALKLSNFFFFAPMVLQSVNTIALANINKERCDFGINLFLKYSVVISLIQLFLFVLFGKWAIATFVTQKDTELIFKYALLIIIGVSVLNIGRPLFSWITIKGSLREVFLKVYLPSGIIGIFVYFILAVFWGAIGVACGNIVVYSLFLILIINYVLCKCPFRVRIHWFAREEKELLFNILRLQKE